MKSNLLVTFVFQAGRLERIKSNNQFAKDMFYTYFNFNKEFKTNIIQFGGFKDKKINWILFYIERELIRRFFKIPLFATFLTNKENYKKIASSDNVIMSSHRIACSMLPMMLTSKLNRNKTKFSFFVMGMFASQPRLKIFKIVQTIYFKIVFKLSDNTIFIGRGEYEYAIDRFSNQSKKFTYIPFGIDAEFWKPSKSFDSNKKSGILFIGNDSNRNYELLIKIASELPDLNFTFVTDQIHSDELPVNINLIKGSWGQETLTDLEIKDLYEKHRITLVPLKNTLQPSGQSVTLQSMAAGTPVIVSNTSGFWDDKNLIDGENIIMSTRNNLDDWKMLICKFYSNSEQLKKISKSGVQTINEKLNINIFYNNLKNLLYE